MLWIQRRSGLEKLASNVFFVVFSALLTRTALASGCPPKSSVAPCFDANSLWLPAGHAAFASLPDTSVNASSRMSFGVAAEVLHGPVIAHVSSPDSGGRDIRVVDDVLDVSLLFAVGIVRNLELSVVLPTRLYQNGAGAGGVTSQSAPPITQQTLRDPRIGIAYSLDDALTPTGLGLRLGLDLSLPLGDADAFSGERSIVSAPSATFGFQRDRFALRVSLGARVRSASEFGDVRLGNQAVLALATGVDLLDPGLLFLSLEGFALPSLGSSRASTANSAVSDVRLLPAEWLLAARSSFTRGSQWSLSGSVGTGLPFSSETVHSSSSSGTKHFLAVTEPELRALLAVRFSPR